MNLVDTFLLLLQSATSQGILWALLAIGVFLTFRILDIADLTAEGSFPLGAGIAAISITNGISPILASLMGFGGGMVAGLVSGLLHTKLKIPALLAGIITMTGRLAGTRHGLHPISSHGTDQKQCRDSCRLSLRGNRHFVLVPLFPYRDRLSIASDGRQFSYERGQRHQH